MADEATRGREFPMREWWQERATWQKWTMGVAGAFVAIALVAPDPEEPEADTTTTTAAPETSTSTSTSTSSSTTTTQSITTTTAAEAFDEGDFLVELVVLEDECFNSAGALVTVEPDLTLTSTREPAPDQELTIVFEIHGGENVETQRIDLTGDSYSYEEHVVSTESCEYELSAEVVQVIER
jgi:hypothetical protein